MLELKFKLFFTVFSCNYFLTTLDGLLKRGNNRYATYLSNTASHSAKPVAFYGPIICVRYSTQILPTYIHMYKK